MHQEIELGLSPSEAADDKIIHQKAMEKCKLEAIDFLVIRKRSIDARQKKVVIRLRVLVYYQESPPTPEFYLSKLSAVHDRPSVIIVGAGPAGYFAALELIESGIRPIVLERGKSVRERRKSLRAIQQFGLVDKDSNYCFGEGGAGTYSDGKLYTRSHKRGKIEKVLRLLVEHGASPDILIDAHPHIGSNKLPRIIAAIRHTIEQHGGEVHFDARVTNFILSEKDDVRRIKGVVVNDSQEYLADQVILATGHSARDIYRLLDRHHIKMEAKAFAMGVRVEHPQPLIDRIQYHQKVRDKNLPAAKYSISCQVDKRGVYSFCMCPGGLIVPSATAPGEIVVNGMSLSRRDSPFANSGLVTEVRLSDLPDDGSQNVLVGMEFQQSVEQKMFRAGDGSQKAPAQRLTDFANRKLSASLPKTSYIPGVFSARVDELLPKFIQDHLQRAIRVFAKTMPGFYTEEANVVAVESRTSSPVRIPRLKENFQHETIVGLFPCGEGAGYAGGIISAALDGQNVAKKIAIEMGK